MKHYKKTFFGSILTFIVGTSCCWMSSLAIWFGGATFLGVIVKYVENFQVQLILLSIGLAVASLILFQKNRKQKISKTKSFESRKL